jgi:hypothetical protein
MDLEGSGLGLIEAPSRKLPERTEQKKKNHEKSPSQSNRCPGRDSNQAPLE